ncbi:phosphatidate cytidylyltransferase [Shimia sp. W99]|uniref:Phosphatidate cytidylyltransferase n=1 Tax=Shimia aestuarii TaxID=254406 RepID=A0A1I4NF65_9RHOB|nr:phosphatidate cytidylyltransferase [Shimia aestuarii]SFM14109.1 phosphatidate cytidylyltransferase [Shimia aestuarii]
MSGAGGTWGDLPARLGSAAVMLIIGASAIWAGGVWFHELVALICGGMIWEFSRLMGPEKRRFAIPMGVLAAAAMAATMFLPGQAVLPVLLAVAIAGATQLEKDRLIYGAYASALILACYGLIVVRDVRGAYWIVWLVSVVVATDVAGYFAGRLLGGPKFWPKVSPKKTWSGTIAGWIAAGAVGVVFGGPALIVLSVLTSFASQMGDAAESALKRRAGIKDSSNLIPGHGGLLDRFDAMMGAALFVLLMGAALGLPAL